ncbi:GNAT family N-acetyltransferase [Brevibacillus antibioticus]|uniref:GNAT family N-acetyltransferase n=1 Tax=Brevibacillus antibioticus TaxID=2570228 RepID=UPI001FCB27BB|nr:GNAT family N-acetyltransferase [Brevibacillus antibioticus]
MTIHLRRTTPADIPFVCEVENAPENTVHYPVERRAVPPRTWQPGHPPYDCRKKETGHPVGYVIIAGLTNPHQSIELMCITIAVKGEGNGRNILRQIKHSAFIEQKAPRLWLDVKEMNDRSLYLSEGFHMLRGK